MGTFVFALGCGGANGSGPSDLPDGSRESAASDGATGDAQVARDGAAHDGSLDGGTASDAMAMRPVSDAMVTRGIATGGSHTCALRKAGLYCWGDNTSGQLGTGNIDEHKVPVAAQVAGSDIVEVAAASGRTCVRRSTGQVACWGSNDYGQLGNGTRTSSTQPFAPPGIEGARQLAMNEDSTCVLQESGAVVCWGGADADDDSAALRPQVMEGLPKLVEIAGAGQVAFCGRDEGGAVFCWSHEWGTWTKPRTTMLVGARALGMTSLDEICALVESGEVVCHNLDTGHLIPLEDSQGTTQITAGALVLCAKKSDPAWGCWNVLASMLEETGSGVIPLVSDVPLIEIAVAGLSACGVREDQRVSCLSATDALPTWLIVENLPD